jgi:hypothetical protein
MGGLGAVMTLAIVIFSGGCKSRRDSGSSVQTSDESVSTNEAWSKRVSDWLTVSIAKKDVLVQRLPATNATPDAGTVAEVRAFFTSIAEDAFKTTSLIQAYLDNEITASGAATVRSRTQLQDVNRKLEDMRKLIYDEILDPDFWPQIAARSQLMARRLNSVGRMLSDIQSSWSATQSVTSPSPTANQLFFDDFNRSTFMPAGETKWQCVTNCSRTEGPEYRILDNALTASYRGQATHPSKIFSAIFTPTYGVQACATFGKASYHKKDLGTAIEIGSLQVPGPNGAVGWRPRFRLKFAFDTTVLSTGSERHLKAGMYYYNESLGNVDVVDFSYFSFKTDTVRICGRVSESGLAQISVGDNKSLEVKIPERIWNDYKSMPPGGVALDVNPFESWLIVDDFEVTRAP